MSETKKWRVALTTKEDFALMKKAKELLQKYAGEDIKVRNVDVLRAAMKTLIEKYS